MSKALFLDPTSTPIERECQGKWLCLPRGTLSTNQLLLLTALYLSLTQNQSFWAHVLSALPDRDVGRELGLVAGLFIALNVLLLFAMAPLSPRRIVRPALGLILVLASVCSYFMDSFGAVIDPMMITSALQTDARETGELIELPLLRHVLLWGLVPAVLVWRVRLRSGGPRTELLRRMGLLLFALVLLAMTLTHYKHLSLWARAHRDVRLYVNPTYPLYALTRHLRALSSTPSGPPTPIAIDARRTPASSGKPRVVVLVVGETARAANFQLDGYARATTPELAGIPGVMSFQQVGSCGTATAVSVPCMFSRLGRASFSRSKARAEENILDVLQRTGVSVLWRDNNSDSKGVALRVPTEDLRHLDLKDLCNAESCYDEVLLRGLDPLIQGSRGDQLIALHLLGSHGPSYYRRYPSDYRRFTPDCARDDVQSCDQASIRNAYDNTILYTDHVLGSLIRLLQAHRPRVEPTMLYLSDHGESLGENGLYLHGLPYSLAPDEQKHVPFVVWSPAAAASCPTAQLRREMSHDYLFHTLLGLFSVSTREYRADLDALRGCSPPTVATMKPPAEDAARTAVADTLGVSGGPAADARTSRSARPAALTQPVAASKRVLPPTAAVLMVSVRSAQKRSR